MVQIVHELEVIQTNGQPQARLDLNVSVKAELPALGAKVDRYVLSAGSCAYVIQSGIFATLDENGTWYDTIGKAVPEPEQAQEG